MGKKTVSDEILISSYKRTNNIWKTGKEVGLSGQHVQQRLIQAGIERTGSGKRWTELEENELIDIYSAGFKCGDGVLDEFCKKHNRTKPFVSRKAKKLGLSCASRSLSQDMCKDISERTRKMIKEKGHPRGALGLKHSKDTLDKISKKSKESWKSKTEDEVSEFVFKSLKTRYKNNTLYPIRKNVSWKGGWRNIGGKDKYYRSIWEANYARYLEFLKKKGQIKSWEHEPDTFWFEEIKRGTRSYLPDFKVVENNGDIVYHEVKGWMDAKSKTKIKRMAKYYPDIKLIVIQAKEYKAILKQMSPMIKDFE